MKYVLLISIIFWIAQVVQALEVSDKKYLFADSALPEYSCLVTLYNTSSPDNARIGSCSGTLLSANHVLTAEHCFRIAAIRNNIQKTAIAITVQCGNETGEGDFTAYPPSYDYHSSVRFNAYLRGLYDHSMITLNKPLTAIRPVKFPRTEEDLKNLMGLNRCVALGHGFDDTLGRGDHKGVFIDLAQVREDETETYGMGKHVEIISGDSGGGVFCQDLSGEYYLVGALRHAGNSCESLRLSHSWIMEQLK